MTEVSGAELSRGSDRRSTWVAIAALVGVWLAFTFPVLAGRTPYPVGLDASHPQVGGGPVAVNPYDSDTHDQDYPWRLYLGSRIRRGELPIWDPHRFGGTPFSANPQSAVFYPPNWAYALGHPLLVFTLHFVFGILVALLLAYWFLRTLALHPMASVLGATAFVFCGFLVAWRNHHTFLASAMWLPLALGALERARTRPPRIWLPVAGLALALSVLGGHPQVALLVWLATGIWALGEFGARAIDAGAGSRARAALAIAGRTAIAFGIGAGLSSVQLLPSLELAGHIVRSGTSASEAITNSSLPGSHLATLLLPDRLGNHLDGNYSGAINYTETLFYPGIAVLILAAFAIWRRRDRITASLVTIGLIGGLSAWGTPVYRLLHAVLPGQDQMARPNRYVFLLDVALAGLGAVGLDTLLRTRHSVSRTLAVCSATVLAGLVASAVFGPPLGRSYLFPIVLRNSLLVVAVAAVSLAVVRSDRLRPWLGLALIGILAADLWLSGFRYHPFTQARTVYAETPQTDTLRERSRARERTMQAVRWSFPPNSAMHYAFYDIGGYDSFVPRRTSQILQPMHSAWHPNVLGPFSEESMDSPVLDLLGVENVVLPPEDPRDELLDRRTALPPAFLVTCWQEVDEGSALHALPAMDADDLRTVALVDRARTPIGTTAASGASCERGADARLVHYEPERVSIQVEPDRRSLLVLTDSWYPGWRVRVDGQQAEVLTVDHAFRGVIVPNGARSVEFNYRPSSLLLGSALTAIATAGALLWALWPVIALALSSGRAQTPERQKGQGRVVRRRSDGQRSHDAPVRGE